MKKLFPPFIFAACVLALTPLILLHSIEDVNKGWGPGRGGGKGRGGRQKGTGTRTSVIKSNRTPLAEASFLHAVPEEEKAVGRSQIINSSLTTDGTFASLLQKLKTQKEKIHQIADHDKSSQEGMRNMPQHLKDFSSSSSSSSSKNDSFVRMFSAPQQRQHPLIPPALPPPPLVPAAHLRPVQEHAVITGANMSAGRGCDMQGEEEEEEKFVVWDQQKSQDVRCSVLSKSLTASVERRFEYGRNRLRVGARFDSLFCYTFVDENCWTMTEIERAEGCEDWEMEDEYNKVRKENKILWKRRSEEKRNSLFYLRRAIQTGSLEEQEEEERAGEGEEEEEEEKRDWFFGDSENPTGWGERAMRVAGDIASKRDYKETSLLLHGDNLIAMARTVQERFSSPLCLFSAASLDGLQDYKQKASPSSKLPCLVALHALKQEKVRKLFASATLFDLVVIGDLTSLFDTLLPHEVLQHLGRLLLLAHVTLLPVKQFRSLLSLVSETEKNPQRLIQMAVSSISSRIKVVVKQTKMDVLQVEVQECEERRMKLIDLDHLLCRNTRTWTDIDGHQQLLPIPYTLRVKDGEGLLVPDAKTGQHETRRVRRGHVSLQAMMTVGLVPQHLSSLFAQVLHLPFPSWSFPVSWNLVLQLQVAHNSDTSSFDVCLSSFPAYVEKGKTDKDKDGENLSPGKRTAAKKAQKPLQDDEDKQEDEKEKGGEEEEEEEEPPKKKESESGEEGESKKKSSKAKLVGKTKTTSKRKLLGDDEGANEDKEDKEDKDKDLAASAPPETFDVFSSSMVNKCNSLLASLLPQLSSSGKILLLGSELSLLGIKIASSLPDVLVLVVHQHEQHARKQRRLAGEMQLPNLFSSFLRMSESTVRRLLSLPDPFDVCILGPHVYADMTERDPSSFLSFTLLFLRFAPSAYLHVPSSSSLRAAMQIVHLNLSWGYDSTQALLQRLEEERISSHRMDVGGVGGGDCSFQLVHLTAEQVVREVKVGTQEAVLKMRRGSVRLTYAGRRQRGEGEQEDLYRDRKGMSLETLMAFGMLNETRALLLRKFLSLSLPEHKELLPCDVVVLEDQLKFDPLDPSKHVHARVYPQGRRKSKKRMRSGKSCSYEEEAARTMDLDQLNRSLNSARVLARLLSSHHNFSFLEYSPSLPVVSQILSPLHPHSSFVTVQEDELQHLQHVLFLQRCGASNVVACNGGAAEVIPKLYESPEFLRFQYAEPMQLLLAGEEEEALLGQLLSCAMTTFLLLPSPRLLSSAFSLLFPSLRVPSFDMLVEDLIEEASVPLRTEVEVTYLEEVGGHVLLRVRLINMTRIAHHHFDYKKDGHARVYDMLFKERRSVRAELEDAYVPGQLMLTRREDEHVIPYKELRAVSLIALLRMGLNNHQKRNFYEQFVRMPLFEDMAPWNIVFEGGSLSYIDQDTQDQKFDQLLPLAYQTMSALMNYIRTVQDFGKCRGKARGGNAYGIPYISDCVRSSFRGPCPSSDRPVPW
eukprot:761404-Hanusia_phi.AAC.9